MRMSPVVAAAVLVSAGLACTAAAAQAEANRATPSYTFRTLASPGTVIAINDAGQAVGYAGSWNLRGVLWDRRGETNLGDRSWAGGVLPLGINARGQIAGVGLTRAGLRAFLWHQGAMTNLGTLGGGDSYAMAINDRGQVVGGSTTTIGETHAVLWDQGTMRDLGTLVGPPGYGYATGVNERGDIIGVSDRCLAPSTCGSGAFLWSEGVMTDLGALGAGSMVPTDINEVGDVVGHYATSNSGFRGWRWSNGKLTELPALGGTVSMAVAINTRGEAVGYAETAAGETHAALWRDGRAIDLGVPGEHSYATGITENGDVIGVSARAGWLFNRVFLRRGDATTYLEVNSWIDTGWVTPAVNARGQMVANVMYIWFESDAVQWDPHGAGSASPASADRSELVEGRAGTDVGRDPPGPWEVPDHTTTPFQRMARLLGLQTLAGSRTPDGASSARGLDAREPPGIECRATTQNPGRGTCAVRLTLPRAARVDVDVLDLQGRKVAVLAQEADLEAGTHVLAWNGHDDRGASAAAGVYLVRVRANGEGQVLKIVLAR